MAKLFGKMEDEKGIEVHKIANRELCANFYYGSREQSIRAAKVCLEVSRTGEEATLFFDLFDPKGKSIFTYTETFPMPKPIKGVV
ncbi:MAG: hypothetical protein QW734_02150 [Candidatus Bathyarchaeia archaeon]